MKNENQNTPRYYVTINNKKRRKNVQILTNVPLTLEWNCSNMWQFVSPCGAEYIVNTNDYSAHLCGAIAFGGATPLEAAQKAAAYNNQKLNEARAADLKYKKWLRETRMQIKKDYEGGTGLLGVGC